MLFFAHDCRLQSLETIEIRASFANETHQSIRCSRKIDRQREREKERGKKGKGYLRRARGNEGEEGARKRERERRRV